MHSSAAFHNHAAHIHTYNELKMKNTNPTPSHHALKPMCVTNMRCKYILLNVKHIISDTLTMLFLLSFHTFIIIIMNKRECRDHLPVRVVAKKSSII